MSNEVKKWTIIGIVMLIWAIAVAWLSDWSAHSAGTGPLIITLAFACVGYVGIIFFWGWLHFEKYPSLSPEIKLRFENENELKEKIWDAFLESYMQDEQWHDTDTMNLIVKKLKGESEIKYAKGVKLC